jgi:fumarate reductase subunit D
MAWHQEIYVCVLISPPPRRHATAPFPLPWPIAFLVSNLIFSLTLFPPPPRSSHTFSHAHSCVTHHIIIHMDTWHMAHRADRAAAALRLPLWSAGLPIFGTWRTYRDTYVHTYIHIHINTHMARSAGYAFQKAVMLRRTYGWDTDGSG